MDRTSGAGDGPSRSHDVALVIPCIDWTELARQKGALLGSIGDDPDSVLWGVIHLIDEIQDQAGAAGHGVVWLDEATPESPDSRPDDEGIHAT